jgi:amino acid permease
MAEFRKPRPSMQDEVHAGGFHAVHRRGEVWHGVFSLVATIVGGGTLSIPWAVNKCGMVLGLSLLGLSAVACAMSVHFLLCAARRCGGLRTYDTVLQRACGWWGQVGTIWSVVVTCFLALVANQILLRQLAVPLVSSYVMKRPLEHWEALALGAGVVAPLVPLTYLRTLNSLRYVSLLSVAAMGTLAVLLVYRGFSCVAPPTEHPVKLVTGDFLSAAPLFVCTYLCSFSALPLDTELRRPNRQRMNQMIGIAFSGSFALYVLIGVAGIMYGRCAQREINPNVLMMFDDDDVMANIMRALLSLVLLLSLPLVCLPCRNMLEQLARAHCGVDGGLQPPIPVLRVGFNAGDQSPDYLASPEGTPRLQRAVIDTDTTAQPALPLPASVNANQQEVALSLNDQLRQMDGRVANFLRPQGSQALRDARQPLLSGLHTSPAPLRPAHVQPPPKHLVSIDTEIDSQYMRDHSSTFPQSMPDADAQAAAAVLRSSEGQSELPLGRRIVYASIIMAGSMATAAAVSSVTVVWGLLGSTAAVLLALIFPSLAYLLLRITPKNRSTSVPRRKVVALTIVIVGVISIPTCLTIAIQNLIQSAK